MVNNLLNITNKDTVYKVISNSLMKLLYEKTEDELKPLLAVPQIPLIAADSYFIHYSIAPMLRLSNPDEVMNSVLDFQRSYMTSERYAKLRTITALDDEMSKVYAFTLTYAILEELLKKLDTTDEIRSLLNQLSQLSQQVQQALQGGLQGGQGGADQQQLDQLTQQAQQITQQLLEKSGIKDDDIKEMVKKASKKAERTTENVSELRRLAGGKEAGKEAGTLEFLADLAKDILQQKVDVEIIELAGKIAESLPKFVKLKKTRSKHGEEIAGYRLTKNIEKALPRELALPDEIFYYKLASNGFLSREMQTVEEGAYYVLIDKSGSMSGEKTVWARAVALALLKLAREKKRRYFLRFFDYTAHELLDDRDSEKLLKHILEIEANGGTSIDIALKTALEDLARYKLSELTNTVIIITDGEDNVKTPPDDFKQANAVLVSVMISGRNYDLERISRESGGEYLQATLDADGALRLVKAVK